MMKHNLMAIALISVAGLSACKSKPPESLPPEPQPTSSASTAPETGPAVVQTGPAVGTQEHFARAVNGKNIIYFDTDRFNIDSEDAAALQLQAQYLLRYTSLRITIAGHADERGTREYNLALGERRAYAAKNYLASYGIDPARITTVSYGKEQPMALGSDESAWAQNRRAVSIIIN